jgi:CBS domain containing-hemolysin-like protein
MVHPVQMVPDSLTLSEILECFKQNHTDFAVIINEYALVTGIITLNDVMSTVMGDLVISSEEAQILEREDGSWLVDGSTPIDDLEHVLGVDSLPEDSTYETVAGFMMYMLRKIPKRTDRVYYGDFRFEVIDVDNNKIDQIIVTPIKKEPEVKTDPSAIAEQPVQK